MEYEWYKESDPHMAAHFASRAIFPYLLIGNVRAANTCYQLFASRLSGDNIGLGVEDVSGSNSDFRVFSSLPLLNFLGLLLLAIQRGAPELYKGLLAKYGTNLAETGAWTEPLEMVAEMYFGIQKPRQSNPLMDMMSGLFGGSGGGGGGSGGGAKPPQKKGIRGNVASLPSEGLD